jgi:hypothetical protein
MSEQQYPPAGRARDRLIAERLGWRWEPEPRLPGYYHVYKPDGTRAPGGASQIDAGPFESDAWPKWSTDANAALPFLKDIPEGYLTWDAVKKVYRAGGYVDGPGLTPEGESVDPADALTRAWLVWGDMLAKARGG